MKVYLIIAVDILTDGEFVFCAFANRPSAEIFVSQHPHLRLKIRVIDVEAF